MGEMGGMDGGMGGGMGGGMMPPGGEEGFPPGEPMPLDIGPPGEVPPGAPPLPEEYNANLEQELILEQKKYDDRKQLVNEDRVYSGYDHYGTNLSDQISGTRLSSGYTHMLNNCQLDGLSTFGEDEKGKKTEQVLIESYLGAEDIKEAKKQALLLLTEQEEEEVNTSDEITPNDLPTRRVFVE